jgi:sugar phosphate isomerase/epimerase
MRLSCLPVSLYADFAAGRRTLADWFGFAASLGLQGADLSVAHLPKRAQDAPPIRDAARDAGVQIVMLAAYTDWTHPDAAFRAAQTDELRRTIEVARALDAAYIRVVAGQDRPGLDEAATYGWVVDGLTACLDDARSAGVGLLYENHVRGAVWTANDWTQPVARFLEVVQRTEGSGLGILFDTANALALGDDPRPVLEAVRGRVGAIHVSDIARVGAFEPTIIGTGVAPIPELLGSMIDAGWDGWVSIEEASRTGEDGFRAAVGYVVGLTTDHRPPTTDHRRMTDGA